MMIDNLIVNENIHPNSREIELLKADFSQFFDKDEEFCIDRFKKMLRSSDITLSKEGYELNFLGKSYARYLSSTKTETFISPDISDNAKEKNKNSENLYIVGDNLDAHQDYIIEPVTSTKKIRMECLSLMKKKQELLEEIMTGILKGIVLVE
ncbi:type III restriction endonuclease EcoP15I, modification subunit [Eubacterium saphenum ATCC 49989]|nr:type III restriction endonuclease EcoP15I, modification subunit [Eubacterium saphenum ATCC 49989]